MINREAEGEGRVRKPVAAGQDVCVEQEAEQSLLVLCVCTHEWKCRGSTHQGRETRRTTHVPRA